MTRTASSSLHVSPGSWEIPFEGYPHLMQLFADLRKMRRAVLSHPLCRAFAAALHTAAVPEGRAVSLCLGHLRRKSLRARPKRGTALSERSTAAVLFSDGRHAARAYAEALPYMATCPDPSEDTPSLSSPRPPVATTPAFMMRSRNDSKDLVGRGLVKKSAQLLTVDTKGTRMR
jgi:hypothetical protein